MGSRQSSTSTPTRLGAASVTIRPTPPPSPWPRGFTCATASSKLPQVLGSLILAHLPVFGVIGVLGSPASFSARGPQFTQLPAYGTSSRNAPTCATVSSPSLWGSLEFASACASHSFVENDACIVVLVMSAD